MTAKKWNLVIDVGRCMDCNDCFLADKDEFTGNDFPPYSVAQPWSGHRWMNIMRTERGQYPLVQVAYRPTPCLHCDDAPCINQSPPGAVYKREDGLVIIDPEKAKGHPEIVATCPYEVIYWNEEAQVAQKCTGCAHLLDEGWTDTRCSQVCPAEAIKLVLADDATMAARAAAEELEVLRPELGARPRVYYKNLHLFAKAFIAGNVVFGDTDECAEGAKATVRAAGQVVGEALASNYGDFYVDRLEPGGEYAVTVEAPGYAPADQHGKARQELEPGDRYARQGLSRGELSRAGAPRRPSGRDVAQDEVEHAQVGRPGEGPIAQVGEAVDVFGYEPAHELVGEEEWIDVRADAPLPYPFAHQLLYGLFHAVVVRDDVAVERVVALAHGEELKIGGGEEFDVGGEHVEVVLPDLAQPVDDGRVGGRAEPDEDPIEQIRVCFHEQLFLTGHMAVGGHLREAQLGGDPRHRGAADAVAADQPHRRLYQLAPAFIPGHAPAPGRGFRRRRAGDGPSTGLAVVH